MIRNIRHCGAALDESISGGGKIAKALFEQFRSVRACRPNGTLPAFGDANGRRPLCLADQAERAFARAEVLAGELGQRRHQRRLAEEPFVEFCDDLIACAIATDRERVCPFASRQPDPRHGPADIDRTGRDHATAAAHSKS
jgi:hypothetical protein